MTLPVYTLGFGMIYGDFFNAIAASMSSTGYGALIHLGVLLGGVWVLVLASLRRQMALPIRWIMTYIVLMSAVLTPKVTVFIIDRTTPQHSRSVSHVPLGLGVLASFTSRIGVGLAELVDDTFHTPDEWDYTHSGMLLGGELLEASHRVSVAPGPFQKNLQAFTEQCIFYDLLQGKYTAQALETQSDLWAFVQSYASPARAFRYGKAIVTCSEGAKLLGQEWHQATQDTGTAWGSAFYRQWGGASPSGGANAATEILSRLPSAYQYFAGMSEDAGSVLQQSMMSQILQDSLQGWSARVGSTSGLESALFAKAQKQKRASYHNLYRMALYWTPLLQVALELVLYALFLIVVFLAFFPVGGGVIKNYISALLWIQCWAPLFAFTNFILNSVLMEKARLLGQGGLGMALGMQTGWDEMFTDLASLAGFLCILVPFLAAGVFKGLMNVFTSIAQVVAGAAQSLSFSAGSDAVSGNLSIGATQLNTHSMNTFSGNQWDMGARVQSGMLQYALPGGSTVSVTPVGEKIFNTRGGVSELPVTIDMAESLSASLSRMGDEAWTVGQRDSQAATDAYTEGLTTLHEMGASYAKMDSAHTSSDFSTSGGWTDAARTVHQEAERYATEHHVSRDVALRAMATVYADVHVGTPPMETAASASAGARIEGSASAGYQRTHLTQTGTSATEEQDLSHAVENVTRAVEEAQHRTGSEFTTREAQNVAAHFEAGTRLATEAAQSFDQAQSYRTQAHTVHEEATRINVSASQAFVNWLAEQGPPPDPADPETRSDHHTGKTPGAAGFIGMDPAHIEEILKHDPALQKYYAEHFIQTHQADYLKAYDTTGAQLPTAASLTAQYQQERPSLPVTDAESRAAIHRAYATHEQRGMSERPGRDLAHQHPIPDTVHTRVEKTLQQAHAAWQHAAENKHTGEEKEAQYQQKQKKERQQEADRQTAERRSLLHSAMDRPFTLAPASPPVVPPLQPRSEPVKPDHSGT